MNDHEMLELLMDYRKLLKKITALTQTQLRFICRQDIRGLKRVIQERESLIAEAGSVQQILQKQPGWENQLQFKSLQQEIAAEQRIILAMSRKGLEAAQLEKNKLKNTLQRFRQMRTAQNRYVNDWMPKSSHRFNAKG
jgi:hypothetical protein